MKNYTFYLPNMNKLISINQEDWDFLSEQAKENGILPSTLAAQIISAELAMWRGQIDYANAKEQEQANQAMVLEKSVEEAVPVGSSEFSRMFF